MSLVILFYYALASTFLFSQVLCDYKVPGLKPEPGHIIDVADAPVGIPIATPEEVAHLPKFFDVREHWPECSNITSHINYQGSCGACWAVSASDVLSDRLCIASKGRIQKRISAYHLLTCCGLGYCADGRNDFGGCRGGDTFGAFSFFDKHGLVTEDCMPFPEWVKELGINDYPTHANIKCETQCEEPSWEDLRVKLNYNQELYRGTSYYRLPNDEATIRKEIYEYGSVAMEFDHSEFVIADAWIDGEFYFCSKENQIPTHGVRAIGWGEHERLGPYWLLANSFGSWWNGNGVFKMARGKNMCNLEKFVVAGVPKVEEFQENNAKDTFTSWDFFENWSKINL